MSLHTSCIFFKPPEEEEQDFLMEELRCPGEGKVAPEFIQEYLLTTGSVNNGPNVQQGLGGRVVRCSGPRLLFALTGGNENSTVNE